MAEQASQTRVVTLVWLLVLCHSSGSTPFQPLSTLVLLLRPAARHQPSHSPAKLSAAISMIGT